MNKIVIESGSFRDPSGFLFHRDDTLFRQINRPYQENYEHLIQSGLYGKLTAQGLLIDHEECDIELATSDEAFKIIKPQRIPYISYPYEWSFSQIKDAALLTLRIQLIALEHGMILKDASAYNVQFYQGRPIFIDTLSFEKYTSGSWVAYKQFCQHFFAPLCLLSYRDQRLSQLYKLYIDGPPLDLVSKLLPKRTWLKYSILAHIHIHARSQQRYADSASTDSGENNSKSDKKAAGKVSKTQVKAIVQQLESAIIGLNFIDNDTEWGDYYNHTNYEEESLKHKKLLVHEFIKKFPTSPQLIQDFGANDGTFSRIAAEYASTVISQDIDEIAVEKNYLQSKQHNESNLLPLLLDLTNPSPGLGWNNTERSPALARSKCDILMALAVIHHMAISNNIPLQKVAELFSRICKFLIIEFVPKEDSQVARLLATREDIFPDYTTMGFKTAFADYFTIVEEEQINGTERTLYLMQVKTN